MQSDNRTDKYLGMAADEARYSDMYHKHGAVLVKGGRVVAKGHNSRRTRLHGANHWRIKGCDLYVVQLAVGADGDEEVGGGGPLLLSDSRPCHLCLGWLRACGVKRVFFSLKIAAHARGSSSSSPPPSLLPVPGPKRWTKQSVELLCAEPHYVTSAERGEARRKRRPTQRA